MIHQHFKLVDVLTAAENIVLGLKRARAGWISRPPRHKEVREISALRLRR
jgi:ABC-type uncharacterized transport system ATPase subunit